MDEYGREGVKVLKKFPIFRLGECRCGCGENIPIRNDAGYLRRFLQKHVNRGIYNSRYKGGKTATEGYPQLNMPWHPNADKAGYVLTHVWMMTRKLGRPLEKGEVVHHINGDKSDFNIDNLELLGSQAEHRTLHRVNMTGRKCSNPECEDPYSTQINQGKYISWYGNEKDGWLCRKCYTKKNYKYVKKGRKK